MIAFCDLPDAQRMALRDAIETAGGEVAAYQGDAVQVAVPCEPLAGTGGRQAFFNAMAAAGLAYVEGSLFFFPLGTDNPPDALRHDGKYHGSRGFWLFARFRPQTQG